MHVASARKEDKIFASLTELVVAADELRRRPGVLLDTVPLNSLRGPSGLSYGQIMPLNTRLQIIELISEACKSVTEAAGKFRHAEVKSLYDEGMTMDEIAASPGVTRQRVPALLRQASRQGLRAKEHAGGRPSTSPSMRPATHHQASSMGRNGPNP
ncbi:MAG: hypothetical protein ACM3ML_29205 [Micromonosporaceae bacterium]